MAVRDGSNDHRNGPIHRNVETVMQLEAEALQRRSFAQHFADRVTAAAGSAPLLVLHVLWFGGWFVVNAGLVPGVNPFDEFPYRLLTLLVSLEAIFLTLLVLMSQNRMMREADKRAHLDLQLNMLAEQEATMSLRMLRRICEHLGIESDDGEAIEKLERVTNVDQLARTLERKLPS
jgi:uncharacterized membrane protein